MLYRVIRKFMNGVLRLCFRVKVEGKENMPMTGGGIVALNHRSNWDVPMAGLSSPRKLGFMAKAEMFKSKLGNWFFSSLGAFPVQRGKGDIGAIKAALSRLKAGELVAMFPEGRRVKPGKKVQPKPGVVMLAVRAEVPVIPVHIKGTYKPFSRVTITFGAPIYYEEFYGEKLPVEELQELSNGLMETINSL